MYRQFALVIAATALTQRHQRHDAEADAVRPVAAPVTPPEQRNVFYRGFNRVYDALEHATPA